MELVQNSVHFDFYQPFTTKALYYAKILGWEVLPVKFITPFEPISLATTNEETIRAWGERYPEAMVVAVSGKSSNMINLSIHSVVESAKSILGALEARYGTLPPTPRIYDDELDILNFYFKYPQSAPDFPGCISLGRGISIGGKGAIHYLPDSYDADLWDINPIDYPLLEMPSWLIHLAISKLNNPENKDWDCLLRINPNR